MTDQIRLWRNKKELSEFYAIFDDDDRAKIAVVKKWYVHEPPGSRTRYAIGQLRGDRVRMHQIIAGVKEGKELDHVNGDGLDNCKCNLRHITHSENIQAAYDRQRFSRRVRGRGVSSVKAMLATGDVATYYYHKATRTRLPSYPGHPDFEQMLADILERL